MGSMYYYCKNIFAGHIYRKFPYIYMGSLVDCFVYLRIMNKKCTYMFAIRYMQKLYVMRN